MESASQLHTIDFIIVTDVHYSLKNISLLKEWVLKQGSKSFQNLQGIIACGDLVNAEPGVSNQELDEKQLLQVLTLLREINDKIWFIPGNHDPASLFEDLQTQLSENFSKINELATNFHCRRVEIAPRLILAGLGGSVDSTIFETAGTIYWKGFPYSEDQLQEKFKCLLNSPIEQQSEIKTENSASNSILLVTHSGPAYTSTTDILYGENQDHVQSGSVAMTSYLKQIKKGNNLSSAPILAHIHGHTHNGLGLSHQIPGHPTINPGALKNGRFIHISFQQQNQMEEPWKLNGIHFITL